MKLARQAGLALTLLTLTACSGAGQDQSSSGSSSSGTPGASQTAGDGSSAGGSTSSSAPASCAQQTAEDLSVKEKAAQLLLVAMQPSSIGTASRQITDGYASGVFLLGGWSPDEATEGSEAVHALSSETGDIGTWVTIDQEGGEVQQLEVAAIPSALEQAGLGPDELKAQATQWGTALKNVGVDVNLAPVADVVPAEMGSKNAPIGLYDRQYGATPEEVTPPAIAFMQGMQDSGVLPTVKHFPGIGRISGNTDMTAAGIDDPQMTTDDPMLQPFQAAIDAGAPIVMISTARYPKIDASNQATFSSAIITDLLRTKMGFGGVTFTDDVGAAKSVENVPVGERMTRFIEAGGDVVLTAQPVQAPYMSEAVVSKYEGDPAFASKVDAAVLRVLDLKDTQGLLPCSTK